MLKKITIEILRFHGIYCRPGFTLPCVRGKPSPMGLKDTKHELFMAEALKQARLAWQEFEEVPIGACVVKDGEIIAVSHNLKETNHSPTAHAEVLALELASQKLGRWRLDDCTLYVTLEPCPMCAGAIVQSRIKNLVFGAHDPKTGAVESLYNITQDPRLNHQVEVTSGTLRSECSQVLKDFFKQRRQQKA